MKSKLFTILVSAIMTISVCSVVFGKTNTIINNTVTIDKSIITNKINEDIITMHHNYLTSKDAVGDYITSFIVKPKDKNLKIIETTYPKDKVERAYDIVFVPDNDPHSYSKKVSTVLVFTEANFEQSSLFHSNIPVLRTDNELAIVEIHATDKNYANLQSADGKKFLELLKSADDNVFPYQLNNDNGVKGINSDFTFYSQKGYELKAYNDKFNDNSNALTKINFYPTTPKDNEEKQLLMSMYVFDINKFVHSEDYHIVKTTNKYIFAINMETTNNFKLRSNQLRFEKYKNIYGANDFENIKKGIYTGEVSLQSKIDEANNKNLKSKPIVVPKFVEPTKNNINDTVKTQLPSVQQTKKVVTSHKLFINGKDSGIEYITDKNGVNFLPIRDTLVKIGFIVEWNSSTKAISYHNSNTTGLMTIDSKEYYNMRDKVTLDYAPTKIDGKSYMPIEWLAGVMPYNYIVKSNGDLALTTES